MNDQTSPTADGQGPGSSPWRNPFEEPQSAHGLPGVPDLVPTSAAGGPGGPGGYGGPLDNPPPRRRSLASLLLWYRSDLSVAAVLVVIGAVFGVLSGLAWYRFAPTVWLTLPANAVPQVTSGVDQSALLVAPEAKGIASVDGYYFVFTAISGLLLGVLGFFLARRGLFDDDRHRGERDGAAIGAWAGVLLGGFAASTLAAALGRWVSMPDPLTVLHIIAAGHNFHAPVALHAQGFYLAAPLLGLLLFLALTAAFTKPTPPQWQPDGGQAYFTAGNPYGFQPGVNPAAGPVAAPQPPHQQPGENGPSDARPEDDGSGAASETNSGAPQADTPLG